ncbi:hypothetical protein KRZ98_18340 [Sphingobium sp. AS12]|uniref:hypothetical protein n=1 Tax=Sphingobium sp. AS12 TaxID=2849495 RepID=UPI001C3144C1|nr:hypothetical protein [Sphingobium sp. AS12]MBV2150198.1 hypothetical protein [Sphingobium sp. AS12]
MIIALLLLIAGIMLFGAGAVKGFLSNAISAGFAFIVIGGLLLWVISLMGMALLYVVAAILGGIALLFVFAKLEAKKEEASRSGVSPSRRKMRSGPQQRWNTKGAPSKDERKRMKREYKSRN